MSQFDLREVYMKENGTTISHDQKVCLLCMQLVKAEFRWVRNEELDAIEKFVPEMVSTIFLVTS